MTNRTTPVPTARRVCHWACTVSLLFTVLLCFCSCSRRTYQRWADRDAYRLLRSREVDTSWDLPDRRVEPDPRSRMADRHDPNCGPLPLDDQASRCYMLHPYHSKTVKYWRKKGEGVPIEQFHWMEFLPKTESGELKLSKQSSVDLALIHSREYQTQVEQLFVSALGLSGSRHEFELQWLGGNRTDFVSTGDGAAAVRDLSTGNNLGFSRNLAAGGQLVTNLANSFAWQLGGTPSDSVTGNLLISLTQPLLRGAFRFVRTEALTQSERDLLYGVRDFAHFRRQFYLDVVSQYLNLLSQAQSVRNERENLQILELNLAEFQERFNRQLVSTIQVDQVFQSYQAGRLSVISAEQGLQAALDNFKLQLGLPARLSSKLDESILDPFQLTDPELEDLQQRIEDLDQSLVQYLPPDPAPREFLVKAHEQLLELTEEVQEIKPLVDKEMGLWRARLKESEPPDDASEDERLEYDRQVEVSDQMSKLLDEMNETLPEDLEAAKAAQQGLDDLDPVEAWKEVQILIGRELTDRISTLFTAQTLIRLYLIELVPVEVDMDAAVDAALENRFDLMNQRARVVDSYRQVEIAANQLKSDLDVTASANLQTDPNRKNPIGFDGNENQYNFSLQFDGPLERIAERNSYRAAQIAYQQQRRTFMALKDQITIDIRNDLRELRVNRFNFEISRQTLIAASRQVDESQFQLRTANTEGTSLTLDLLQALQGLRDAKNSLISSWVNYEISRIRLFVDLELLMLDENGVWINEHENPAVATSSTEPADDAVAEIPADETGEDNGPSGANPEPDSQPVGPPDADSSATSSRRTRGAVGPDQ